MRTLPFIRHHRRALAALAVIVLLGTTAWWISRHTASREAAGVAHPLGATAHAPPSAASGPPWVYGRADARFTVVEFADLECPYCRAYFPVLKAWIDAHPEVNWQWQHLPLAMHEPAATAEARIVECAGKTGGHAAFWGAVAWIYANTRSDGQGVAPGVRFPDLTPDVQRCLDSERPDATIRSQSAAAAKLGINATPTLQVRDRQSGKTIVVAGPLEGDALLSAIDWVSSEQDSGAVAARP